MSWDGQSNISGAGPLNIPSGTFLAISGTAERYVDGGTVNNSGTITWTGANNIALHNGGTINNLSGGTFDAQNDQLIHRTCGCGSGAFSNAGLFKRSEEHTSALQSRS